MTLERSLNLDHQSILTLCDLGVAYLQVQNFPKAKSLFLHALGLDPKNTRAQECLEAVERLQKMASGKLKPERIKAGRK